MKKMRIYASLSEHINDGFVYLKQNGLPKRGIVEIKNLESGKSICCEAFEIDEKFLKKYQQNPRVKIQDPDSAIVMNEWYREQLGDIETQREYPIGITEVNSLIGKIRACMDHPQVVNRVAARLGVLGFCLGASGFLLGLITILT